jgi:hypothetical protein
MMADGISQHVGEAFVVVTKRSAPFGYENHIVLGKQLHLRWPEQTWSIKSEPFHGRIGSRCYLNIRPKHRQQGMLGLVLGDRAYSLDIAQA